jgi:serine protease Do
VRSGAAPGPGVTGRVPAVARREAGADRRGWRSRASRRGLLGLPLLLLLLAGPASAERYGWFGIRIRDLSEAEMEELSRRFGLGEGFGVMVAEVLKDTPAEAAGLLTGDLIVAIDGRPIVETRTLQRLVGESPAGRELRVVVLREGRRRELRVRVGEMPADAVADRVAAEFGFFAREPSPDEAGGGDRRPVVAAVAERSAAERGGLQVGDRLLVVGGTPVATLEELRERLRAHALREALPLGVERRGEALRLLLPPARPATPAH